MSDEDKIKISKMPRKEVNSEILHCWREQEELVLKIQRLEKERDVYKDALRGISFETFECRGTDAAHKASRAYACAADALAKGAEIASGKC